MIRLSAADIARLGAVARARAEGKPAGDPAPARPRAPRRKAGVEQVDGTTAPKRATGRLARNAWDGPEVEIEIDLQPRPKERARTFADERALVRAFASAHGDTRRFMAAIKRKGDGGEGGIMRSVTPEATRRYEEAIGLVASRAMARAGLEPFACPLEADVVFRFSGDPAAWPTAENDGDLDNLAKAVFDGMNGLAYIDDRLLVRKALEKRCSERAGITIRIRPARPGDAPWRMAEAEAGHAVLVWRTPEGAMVSAPMAAAEAVLFARTLAELARLWREGLLTGAGADPCPLGAPLVVREGGPGWDEVLVARAGDLRGR